MQLYSQILDHAGPAFGIVLRHIRDRPNDPCLFHCTGMSASVLCCSLYHDPLPLAGKDRTGVLAALLLKVRHHPNQERLGYC